MSWARMDDNFDDDPEVDLVGPVAVCLFVCAITWCSRNLTDGFLPKARLGKLSGGSDTKAAKALIKYKWIVEVEDGYQVRSYLKYNPSAEQVLAERAKTNERQRRFQESKRSSRGPKTTPPNGVNNGVIDGVNNAHNEHFFDTNNALVTHAPDSRVPEERIGDGDSLSEGVPRARAEGGVGTQFVPPTEAQVIAHFTALDRPDEGPKFWAHYQGNGWMKGEVPVVSWQYTAQSWLQKSGQFGNRSSRSQQSQKPVSIQATPGGDRYAHLPLQPPSVTRQEGS